MEDIPVTNEQHQAGDIEGQVDNSDYNDALIFLNNDTDEDNAEEEKLQTRRRSKRCVKFTDKLRSPNFNRVVDPSSGLKSSEARVSGMVFAGIGNEWYLNSPARLFVSCTLLSNYVFDETICLDKRFKMFYNRMNEYLFKFHPHIDFHQIDLVFYPIISYDHYYLIVFNFQNYSCVIIDHIFSKESFYVTYGNIPYDLDMLFKLYLDSVKHSKRSQMKAVQRTKFIMSWMTRSNYTDCGIFLMRHMETYKGEELQDWKLTWR
ncbi:hypothetical protein LXL04_016641 [Taraxacum kok-saghyz]